VSKGASLKIVRQAFGDTLTLARVLNTFKRQLRTR
jgi:hypothetical protein